MDRKTKYLVAFLVVFFALSVGAKFYHYHVERDYLVVAETSCDPETESCFIWDCDMGENPECDHTPYAYITKNVSNVPYCNPYEGEECDELTCGPNEPECEITYCSEDEAGEDEYCDEID